MLRKTERERGAPSKVLNLDACLSNNDFAAVGLRKVRSRTEKGTQPKKSFLLEIVEMWRTMETLITHRGVEVKKENQEVPSQIKLRGRWGAGGSNQREKKEARQEGGRRTRKKKLPPPSPPTHTLSPISPIRSLSTSISSYAASPSSRGTAPTARRRRPSRP